MGHLHQFGKLAMQWFVDALSQATANVNIPPPPRLSNGNASSSGMGRLASPTVFSCRGDDSTTMMERNNTNIGPNDFRVIAILLAG